MASESGQVAAGVQKSEPELNRKNAERIRFAKALLSRAKWSVQDFAEHLNYEDAGICGKTECGIRHITDAHLTRVFPNKGGSGIRVVPNEFVSEEECGKLLELYLAMYNHPPPNKEYARFFLRSWLAEREGKVKINWAKFAYDICRKQYAQWEKDGRVEEACNAKWDDLAGLENSASLGEGQSQGQRRQFGAACQPVRFTTEQNGGVRELLKTAEADNEGWGPKMSVLEYRRSELERQCKGVDGALAERRKSLREEELSFANMQKRRESLVEHFRHDRVIGESEGTEIQVVGETCPEEEEELRTIDKDLEFGLKILNRESARTEQLQEEQVELDRELKKLDNEIRYRGLACSRAEMWVAKLTDQVQLMAAGSGMGTTPLPIRNPRVPPEGRAKVIHCSNCPVCGFNFKCHNISVADCECAYHHFCLAAWLSDGRKHCAGALCEKEFSSDWLDSFGANQIRIPLVRQPMKTESRVGRFSALDNRGAANAASTNFAEQVPSASGTPVSQRYEGPLTPSSGKTGTPASGSWRTPTGSAGRVNAFGGVVHEMDAQIRLSPAHVQKSGTPSVPGSGTGRTSDDSIVGPDDDVCLSQARAKLQPVKDGVAFDTMVNTIPETLPGFEGSVLELIAAPELDIEETDTPMSDKDGGGADDNNVDREEVEMAAVDMPSDGENKREGTTDSEPEDQGSKKSRPNQTVELRDTRRQAALRNTLCPSPGVDSGAGVHTGIPSRVKKGTVGRGRATQNAARTEKGVNMKPLTHFGLQEKFKAPAVVSDAGKGRGRGGKHPKRKRDGPGV